MNQKEVSELRRRFRPDRSAIGHIYGCYVNGKRQIVSYLDLPFGIVPQEEAELYLGLLKKALSGVLGRNLIDIVFTTRQVGSEEHRLLTALRDTQLKGSAVRQAFYDKAIASLDFDGGNYLILLVHDAYDVPYRGMDGEVQQDASDAVFSYVICCACLAKEGKAALGYFPGDNEFHCVASQLVASPELGFLFPAFDNRAANLYNALFYTKKTDLVHQAFVDAVFHTETPMSAAEQKDTFAAVLSDALDEACSMAVVQAVHGCLREQIVQHRESRDPEPLEVSEREVEAILTDCAVPEERVAAFRQGWTNAIGTDSVLNPANLIDRGKFEI